jgi:YebC/PmpR family DNA-binding regulatory protein
VDNAKAGNMPADNITRAIKKGTGELEGVNYEEIAYEGYGPGGVALYIETLTDNQNRTVADVRHILTKLGGSLGTAGSVGWQFDRKGQIYVDVSRYDEESVFGAAIDAGADDVEAYDDEFVVTTEAGNFHEVQAGMKAAGIEFERAELTWIPQNEIRVEGRDAEKLIKLLEALDDIDDVQEVSSNADIDEEILAQAM